MDTMEKRRKRKAQEQAELEEKAKNAARAKYAPESSALEEKDMKRATKGPYTTDSKREPLKSSFTEATQRKIAAAQKEASKPSPVATREIEKESQKKDTGMGNGAEVRSTRTRRSAAPSDRSDNVKSDSRATKKNAEASVKRTISSGRKDVDRRTRKQGVAERKSNTEETKSLRLKKGLEYRREKKRWQIFWIVMGVYVIIFGIAAIFILGYMDRCLTRYEQSQSVYAMEDYLRRFSASVSAGKIPEELDLSGYVSDELTLEEVNQLYLDSIAGKELTFEKARDSYLTEEPEYVIKADDMEAARVKFTGEKGEVLLAILTVLDWKLDSVSAKLDIEVTPATPTEPPAPEIPTYQYHISIPYEYTAYADGEALLEEQLVGEGERPALFQYAGEYADLHGSKLYEIESEKEGMAITVTDAAGNPVTVVQDGDTYTADYVKSDVIPEELLAVALDRSQMWSLYMTRDLTGELFGFYNMAANLINGSYYYNMAYEWATGPDITFTSPHTLDEPVFSNVAVTDFVQYNDMCFSCHIYFTKVMHLTVTGQDVVDTTDSTFVFVNCDDSDDGVFNPHWVMVDMIQTLD